MLDSTVLLRNVISWNEEQVLETLKWLAKQQKEDGSFIEDKDAIMLRNDMVSLYNHVIEFVLHLNCIYILLLFAGRRVSLRATDIASDRLTSRSFQQP